jgi:hypothetical protein
LPAWATAGLTGLGNATCQISATFTPTGQGTRSAMLSVSDNAPGSPQSIGLTGVTTPAAALSLSTSSITFPDQFVGTTGLPQTITATNTGNATLTITSVATTSNGFGVLNACGGSLAAGSSCSIGSSLTQLPAVPTPEQSRLMTMPEAALKQWRLPGSGRTFRSPPPRQQVR